MEVKLDITQANFGATIEDLFASLTLDDKKALAEKCMLEVLQKPNGAERIAYERELLDRLVADGLKSGGYGAIKTEAEARQSYQFREAIAKYQSSQERMVKEIVTAAIANYKDLVVKLVTEDEQLRLIYEEVRATVAAQFPQMVQAALIAHFAKDMGSIGVALINTASLSATVGGTMQMLTAKLQTHGIDLTR